MADGKAVGRLTAGVVSPTLDCGIGYVVFDEPADWPGQRLQVRLPNGNEYPCEVVELPFFDREKNIVRGIDRTIPEIPHTSPSMSDKTA